MTTIPKSLPTGPTPFHELVALVEALLGPNGCPWDQKQTLETVKKYLLEETHEVIDAIDQKQVPEHCEELGDVLFQVVFQAELQRKEGHFSIEDVCRAVTTKMIRRHPHVFGDLPAQNEEQIVANWERIKREEQAQAGRIRGRMEGIPKSMTALQIAQRMGEQAAKVGFDWPTVQGVRSKIAEEMQELDEALSTNDPEAIAHELGDVLFTLTRLAGKLGMDAEAALRTTNQRFKERFEQAEQQANHKEGDPSLTLEEWNRYWSYAKQQEQIRKTMKK